MKKLYILPLFLLILYGCGASKALMSVENSPVITNIDLVHVLEDKVQVELNPGAFTNEKVVFRIPKTVPGTYSTDNYGKYIQDFKALDYSGKSLDVSKLDENSWSIANASQLDKVYYLVNDTFDTENEVPDAVFSPAGTNIEKGSNFLLNLHGFVGYFDGFKERPYEISITKPEALVATTSLKTLNVGDSAGKDIFVASRYFEVIDNPILYAKPNREVFQINDITVTLSVFSPNGVYKASDLRERMVKMMTAQKAFLGDVNSTKEYSILLYLSDISKADAQGFGALEHHTSTVVVLPEQMPLERLEQAMVDVVSHEFFHIVTPLSVHSKEIQYFDFNDPKMSQHLWMYEGTTEYFANLFQIQEGLINEDEFFERLREKINNSKRYDDNMSFTVMSTNILEEPYEANYANVYEKGALINMCLDILLRENSNGEKGVLWLMKELSKKYGKDLPFNDDDLIPEIIGMTYPEIGVFLNDHVVGEEPIDYEGYLKKAGLATLEVKEQTGYFLDGQIPYIDVDVERDSVIFIREGIELNSFFTGLELKGGDVIKTINGKEVNIESIRPIIGESFGWNEDTLIAMEIEREGEVLAISGPVGLPTVTVKKIVPLEDASANQIALRKSWLSAD